MIQKDAAPYWQQSPEKVIKANWDIVKVYVCMRYEYEKSLFDCS